MTVEGTVHKSFVLVTVVIATAALVWMKFAGAPMIYAFAALGIGTVLALIISFFPKTSPFLAIPYAAAEGALIAFVSSMFEAKYPGIVPQAAALTF